MDFGHAVEAGSVFEPLATVDRRGAGVMSVAGEVVWNAALRVDHGAVADSEVAGGADLSSEDAVGPDVGGASQAHLATE